MDNKKLTKLSEGTQNSDAITKHQLDTGLNTKLNASEVSSTADPEAGKLIRYTSDSGLITKRIYIEDRNNDLAVIESDDQDFDDVTLYIPDLKNYDGISGRRKSDIVVNSIDNTFTGKIILPSAHLKIKDGNNEIKVNRVDIEKLVGSASGSNGLNSNKCVLYDNNQDICCKNLGIKVQNNVIFFRGRGQTASRSLWTDQLSSDANIILSETNQTLNGDKVFS